jgi:hypothetical protein
MYTVNGNKALIKKKDPYLFGSCRVYYSFKSVIRIVPLSTHYRVCTELDWAIRLIQFILKGNRIERVLSTSETYFVLQSLAFYVVGQTRANVQMCR